MDPIENIKNLINACDGYFIKQILDEFNNLGYIVNAWGCYGYKYYENLYLLGVRPVSFLKTFPK